MRWIIVFGAVVRAVRWTSGGIDHLGIGIGRGPDTLEDVYEPYLMQQGLLIRTPKGRQATERAYEHLGIFHEPTNS